MQQATNIIGATCQAAATTDQASGGIALLQ
jgi:hypothetical protein